MFHSSAVIDLDAVRRARSQGGRSARTVFLRVSNIRGDGETHRHLGINDSLPLSSLAEAIIVSFGLETPAPTAFIRQRRLNPQAPIFRHLGTPGDELDFRYGLWRFSVSTVESWPREDHTPWALCVGGSGSFGAYEFNPAAINLALLGDDTTKDVLASVHPRVRKLIIRAKVHDLIPILQALDLQGEVTLGEDVEKQLGELREDTDEFYAHVLAAASFSNQLLDVLIGEDAGAMPAELAEMLAARAPVDRLDIYRYLLRPPPDA